MSTDEKIEELVELGNYPQAEQQIRQLLDQERDNTNLTIALARTLLL